VVEAGSDAMDVSVPALFPRVRVQPVTVASPDQTRSICPCPPVAVSVGVAGAGMVTGVPAGAR
jgi:hypothetical protein